MVGTRPGCPLPCREMSRACTFPITSASRRDATGGQCVWPVRHCFSSTTMHACSILIFSPPGAGCWRVAPTLGRSSPVFSCWEGAVLLPRTVFEEVGGWAEPFFYAHEGIELAWRVWETGRI